MDLFAASLIDLLTELCEIHKSLDVALYIHYASSTIICKLISNLMILAKLLEEAVFEQIHHFIIN